MFTRKTASPRNRTGKASGAVTLLAVLPLLLLSGCRTQSQTATPAAPPVAHSSFSGDIAYGMLQAQCDLGPRPPQSKAHERCKALILRNLTPYVDATITQPFTFRDDSRHVTLSLTNILGVINPTAKKKVMLFTHWDTRPTADNDLDHKDRPIVGADDGASGTAVLLELARVFHQKRPDLCVELLFVDGEDWGPGEDKMYLGAIHFADAPGAYRPAYAILLDMIGDKNLTIYREVSSQRRHPELNDTVWNAAASLGYSKEFPAVSHNQDGSTTPTRYQISDDHDSFNAAGIPAIDLIDFDYPYWHTLQDTSDKCSPESLKVVGDVMAKVVYEDK